MALLVGARFAAAFYAGPYKPFTFCRTALGIDCAGTVLGQVAAILVDLIRNMTGPLTSYAVPPKIS